MRHQPHTSPGHAKAAVSRRVAAWAMATTGGLLLAACSGTLLPKPGPAPARFTLEGGASVTSGPSNASVPSAFKPTLLLELPRAAPGYDSPHMLYLRQAQALEAFAFHEWVAAPSQMVAPLLMRALQVNSAFSVVLLAPTAAGTAWRLQTDQLRLHQDFTQHPSRVRMSLRAVLMNGNTRQALAWREFDVSVPAAQDNPVAGAAAAQAAAQQLSAEVAAFCAEQLAALAASTP